MPQKKTFTPLSSHNGRSGSNSNLGIKSKDNEEEEWYPKRSRNWWKALLAWKRALRKRMWQEESGQEEGRKLC